MGAGASTSCYGRLHTGSSTQDGDGDGGSEHEGGDASGSISFGVSARGTKRIAAATEDTPGGTGDAVAGPPGGAKVCETVGGPAGVGGVEPSASVGLGEPAAGSNQASRARKEGGPGVAKKGPAAVGTGAAGAPGAASLQPSFAVPVPPGSAWSPQGAGRQLPAAAPALAPAGQKAREPAASRAPRAQTPDGAEAAGPDGSNNAQGKRASAGGEEPEASKKPRVGSHTQVTPVSSGLTAAEADAGPATHGAAPGPEPSLEISFNVAASGTVRRAATERLPPAAGLAASVGATGPAAGAGPSGPGQPPGVVFVTDFQQLQDTLNGLRDAVQRQGNEAVGAGGREGGPAPVLDLGGRQLGGLVGQVLEVPAHVRCTITHGSIHVCVAVCEGADVLFKEVVVRGRPGQHVARVAGAAAGPGTSSQHQGGAGGVSGAPAAVVTVQGHRARALLDSCEVVAEGEQQPDTGAHACVQARVGGRVEMRGGSLAGAASGLVVRRGSTGEAVGTKAEGCAGAGFSATGSGAALRLRGCTARGNGGDGYGAFMGGRVEAWEDSGGEVCRAEDNGGYGMHAQGAGSVLAAGAGTVATGNGWDGLGASEGGELTAGDGVEAARNRLDGLCVYSGGRLVAGNGVTSCGNERDGFACYGAGSILEVGDRAKAAENGESGYHACRGGMLLVGSRAEARDNKMGFLSDLEGSRMEVGRNSVSRGNASSGYQAQFKSELVIGGGGRAEGSGEEGVVAAAAATVVFQAGGFTATGNGTDGLAAGSGGRLDASAGGLVTRGNKGHGMCVEDRGSVISLGSGSVVQGNAGSGCLSLKGGVLRMGPGGGRVVGNGAWGLLADGRGARKVKARIEGGEDWEVSGNAAGDREAERRAVLSALTQWP